MCRFALVLVVASILLVIFGPFESFNLPRVSANHFIFVYLGKARCMSDGVPGADKPVLKVITTPESAKKADAPEIPKSASSGKTLVSPSTTDGFRSSSETLVSSPKTKAPKSPHSATTGTTANPLAPPPTSTIYDHCHKLPTAEIKPKQSGEPAATLPLGHSENSVSESASTSSGGGAGDGKKNGKSKGCFIKRTWHWIKRTVRKAWDGLTGKNKNKNNKPADPSHPEVKPHPAGASHSAGTSHSNGGR